MRVIEGAVIQTEWDPLMDLRGLSAYSTLSRRTLQDLINDPDDPIPSYRVGNRVLIRRSEFDAWLSRRRNQKPLALARLARADAQALLSVRRKS
ncbi:MAG: helix-turn-helix domain-containing protein [candidate division NC10 bacterium]|nr:helix-turn-helix domain-containing protein [candidate division NC10 bacterium]